MARKVGESSGLERHKTAERRLRERFRHIPGDVHLAGELIAKRRAEAYAWSAPEALPVVSPASNQGHIPLAFDPRGVFFPSHSMMSSATRCQPGSRMIQCACPGYSRYSRVAG